MPPAPSTHAHEAVLSATLKLIASSGIEGTSVDEIADASGVSKATIYKHWPNKDALCIEAIGRVRCDLPVFDSGDPRSDITELLRHLALTQKPEAFGKIWARVISYAISNPDFGKAFRAHMAEGRRAQLEGLLQQAIARGELREDLDLDLAMGLLLGPVMYHRLMESTVPRGLPECVVESFWRVHAPEPKKALKKLAKSARKS